MALNELIETFETLKKLIEEHGDYLSGGGGAETRTRQVLIDPLLKELGWDVGDPSQVELELPMEKPFGKKGQLKPDYTLRHGRKAVAVVEAKAIGSRKLDEANGQALEYAFNRAIPYAVVTNGDEWRLIDVQKPVLPEEKVETLFTITSDSPSSCALRALKLWNPNLSAHEGPVTACEPVLVPIVGPHPPPDVWRKLSRDLPTVGRRTAVRYNGNEKKVTSWATMHQAVGKLMVKNGDLTRTKVPLRKGKAILVNDGEAGIAKPMKVADGMYVNGVGFAKSLINRSVALCEAVGIDPASVEVCFE